MQIKTYTKKYGSLEHVGESKGDEEHKENGDDNSEAGSELSETSDLENHNNESDQEMDNDEEEKNMSDDGDQISQPAKIQSFDLIVTISCS